MLSYTIQNSILWHKNQLIYEQNLYKEFNMHRLNDACATLLKNIYNPRYQSWIGDDEYDDITDHTGYTYSVHMPCSVYISELDPSYNLADWLLLLTCMGTPVQEEILVWVSWCYTKAQSYWQQQAVVLSGH